MWSFLLNFEYFCLRLVIRCSLQPFTLILFHSLHYERCKAAREIFRRAADLLAGDKRIGLGAVDCHREPEQGCK